MGGGSSRTDRRYDYTASSLSEEHGGKELGEKALAQAAREEKQRRHSRAKLDVVAKTVYEGMKPFEHYKYEKKLGEGAFSNVFRAVKLETYEGDAVPANVEKFAVKEIYLKPLSRHQCVNMEREIQILSQLNHPDVVQMYSVYRIPSQMYIVLEYLRGGELLKAVCQRQRYTEDDARALLRPILEGVRYLHSRDVIHRDIKPENLILSDKSLGSVIKIVDFGFACLTDRDEELKARNGDSGSVSPASSASSRASSLMRGTTPADTSAASPGRDRDSSRYLCGTPGYLAPEVIKSKLYTTCCDMWSVGVVTYILLSGTMPFSTKTNKHVLTGTFTFPEERWGTVSEEAKDLIRMLLEVRTSERYTAEQALQHPWMRAVGVVGRDAQQPSGTGTSSVPAATTPSDSIRSHASTDPKKRKSSEEYAVDSEGSSTGVKKEKSEDKEGGSPSLGDLTENLKSIRTFTALRKFHRSMSVVSAAVRFKGAGLQRERRRSESMSSTDSNEREGGEARRPSLDLKTVSEDNADGDYQAGPGTSPSTISEKTAVAAAAASKTVTSSSDADDEDWSERESETGEDKDRLATSLGRYFDDGEDEPNGPPVVVTEGRSDQIKEAII